MTNLAYFCFDDWNGFYIDGELVVEGHSWDWSYIFEKLESKTIGTYQWLEGNYEVLGNLDPWGGRCPEKLQDLLDYPNGLL